MILEVGCADRNSGEREETTSDGEVGVSGDGVIGWKALTSPTMERWTEMVSDNGDGIIW